MRIVQVCPYALDRSGGVQEQAIGLTEWLARAGHQVTLTAPGTSGGPPGTIHLGRTLLLPANRSRAPISLRPDASSRIAEITTGADIVHIHEPLVPMVGLGALLAATPPKVGTFHADPGPAVARLYRGGRRLLAAMTGRLAAATAVSETAATPVRPFVADLRIIPNGIEAGSFRMAGVERHRRRVAFLGRDEPRKGLDVLLAAWQAVRRAVPEAELVVMGADRPAAEGVEFAGAVDEEQKRSALAAAAVFVAPNLGGESFGIVIAEAMAAGCAVVASSLRAFRDVVGDAGILVPVGDTAAVADAVIELLRNDEARRRLSEAGVARAQAFDLGTVAAAYERLYREVLQAGADEADNT